MSVLAPIPEAQEGRARILGIDAGTAHTGLAAIELSPEGVPAPIWCHLVKTRADDSAVRNAGRAQDDKRRLHEVADPILHAISNLRPRSVAYEEYTTYDSSEVDKTKKMLKALFLEAADYGLMETENGKRHPRAPEAECFDLIDRRLTEIRQVLSAGNAFVGTRGRGRATRTLTVVGSIITAARAYGVESVPHYAGQLKRRFPGKGKSATMEGVRTILAGTDTMLQQCGVAPSDWNHVYDAWGHALLAAGI